MTKRNLIALLALVLIAAGGALWVALGSIEPAELGAAVGREADGVVAAESSSRPAGPELVGLPTMTDEEARQDSDALVAEEQAQVGGVSAARRDWWKAPKSAYWAHGRVEIPAGAPLDEAIWITAEGGRFVDKPGGRDTHTARVAEDGTFSVAFSSRTVRRGRLILEARYSYLEKDRWVDVRKLGEEELVLEPELGGRVVARVLPPRSAAFDETVFEGVAVKAARGGFMGATLRDGWLIEAGEFELGGLEPESEFNVLAESPSYADGKTEGVTVEAGRTTFVDVALALGARVSGTVLDHEGEPLNDALVSAMTASAAGSRNPFMRVTPKGEDSTQDGRFQLLGVPAGEIVIVVDADGFLEKTFELGELAEGDERSGVVIRLDRGRLVAGHVKWPDGSPAAGATVRLSQEDQMQNFEIEKVKGDIELGPEGYFEFSALLDGKCSITAVAIHPDDRPDPDSRVSMLREKRIPRWMVRVEDVAPGTMNLDLSLTPGNILSGKVVDDQGQPVKAFKVAAYPQGGGMFASTSMKPVRGRFKDASGEFDLEAVQPGDWEVKVDAAGYADSDRVPVSIPNAGEVRFVIPRTSSIAGTVRAPGGELMKKGRVTVSHGGNRTTAVDVELDGTYIAGKIEPGWVEIAGDAENLGRSEPIKFQISPAQNRKNVTVTLNPGAVLSGEVHPDSGNRVGRTVTLSGGKRGQRKTDDNGSFMFEGLDPGKYELTLEPDSNADFGEDEASWMLRFASQKTQAVELAAGEQMHVVLGAPSATQMIVRGKVTKQGEPVPNALVMATDLDKKQQQGGRPDSAVRSDESGEYRLTIDRPGKWRFQVGGTWEGRVSFVEEVSEGEEVRIDFEIPEARIEGVLSGPGGEPLPQMRVSLVEDQVDAVEEESWFGRRFAQTDENGVFSFENLQPGTYNLRAGGSDGFGRGFAERGAEYGRAIVVVEVKDENHLVEKDVRLAHAGTITGRVLDGSGAPVISATLRVTDEEGRKLSQWNNVRSGADGSFEYAGVAPGSYLVTARKSGDEGMQESKPRKVRVYGQGVAETLLTLD